MRPVCFQRIILTFFCLIFLLSTACSPKNATPPYLSLLPYPSVTHHSLFSIRGKKNPGNGVLINNRLVVPMDGSSFWSGEVTLTAGNNTILIKSTNELGNESAPMQINVTLNASAPSPPAITFPLSGSSWSIPVSIQGSKDSNANILVNGKEIVSFTPSSLWSYTFSPLQGTTLLQFSSRNSLGNESSKTPFTVFYNGPSAPALLAPLDGESIKYVPGVFNSLIFSWTNTGSATYRIQVSPSPDFSSLSADHQPPGSPYSLSDPLSQGIYYWRVGAAYDASGNVYYSPPRKFSYGKIRGDFNGDGYADILVGAEGTTGPGQVRIFFGGTSTPRPSPDLILSGENGGDLFGTALATGDLNGDGYDDIIVGAYHNGAGGNRSGRVYIYFGGPTLHTTPDVVLTGFSAGEQFGVSVASGQDINRDGYDDLLVGANLNSLKGDGAGRAYLFLGGKTLSSYPDMVFNGEAPGDHFGISVAMGGDINGDGFADFLIGAGGDGSGTHIGKAYLFNGEFEPGNQPQMVFSANSNSPGDGFGRMVQGIKDVNGDGYDDFLLGAPFHRGQNGEPEAGEAYLYLGGPNLKANPDLVLRLPSNIAVSKANFGFTSSSIGDIPTPNLNGSLQKDGYADFVIGAYGQITQSHTDNNGNLVVDVAAGVAHLFRGGAIPSANIFQSLSSGNAASNELFSVSLASPGDFNGDGFADLIIGAMMADQAKGRAYYYDGYSLSAPLLCSTCALFGISAQEGFGFAVH